MRLNLHKGQVVKYKLLVERNKPKGSGEFDSSYTISKLQGDESTWIAGLPALRSMARIGQRT